MTWNARDAGGAGPPLPSLNALWTFDAVVRHGNMSRAAAELSVTQTAVSHQIKRLEEELGYSLFRRVGRRTELTAAGAAWAQQLGPLFSRLRSMNQQLRGSKPSALEVLSISAIPSFATRFLVPRLSAFLERHRDVRLRVAATERMVDLDLEQVDVAIRYGRGKYPGFHVTQLCRDAYVPVSSPNYQKRHNLTSPNALRDVDVLHDDYPDAWVRWGECAGIGAPSFRRSIEYTESSMLVEAVLLGQGVGLCRQSLIGDELRAGRLVRLFPSMAALPCELAYYVLVSEHAQGRKLVRQFLRWLEGEVRQADLSEEAK